MSENASPSLLPHIVVRDAAGAIDFYTKAFGAEELFRMPAPDGKSLVHAEIMIAGSRIMLADENPAMDCQSPQSLGGSPITLHLNVADVDSAFDRAVSAGAEAVMPPADMFWGDRYARISDPFGHSWALATHVRDVSEEEMKAGMEAAMSQGG